MHQLFDIVIRQTSPGDANDEELERLSTAHAEKLSQLQEDMRKAMEAQKALEVEKQKRGILFNVCYCKYYAQVCYVGVQQRAKMMMQEEDNQGSDDEDEQHHGSNDEKSDEEGEENAMNIDDLNTMVVDLPRNTTKNAMNNSKCTFT